MAEWRTTTLGEMLPLAYGRALPENRRLEGVVPVVSSAGITGRHSRAIVETPSLVVGRKGNVGSVFYLEGPSFPIDTAFYTCGTPGFDLRFGYYLLIWLKLNRLSQDSAVPGLSRDEYSKVRVTVPGEEEQRAIAEVLGALDDKIAANTRLVALGSELLDVEFERSLAGDSRLVELGAVAEFLNRRRIPLSSREREVRSGSIPYYGASGVFGWVDEAIFDARLVLVGEDGSVITEDRHPVTQYIWGPSWVNNHAHVLSGCGLSTEMLYLALRRADVSTLVTGAVQPKISMGNLKRLEIRLPDPSEAVALQARVDAWFGTHRALTAENLTLAATRDALLPALMSGTLRVRDAERVVEDAV